MIKEQLQQLFRRYLNAFKAYDIDSVVNCYHIPCTLNTPDNIVLVNSATDCQQEFNNIFIQLKQNCTSNIIAQKLSYQQVTDTVYMVCIDWDFLDEREQVFADFSAIYHLVLINGELKIINVISHELDNSLPLTHSFEL